MAKITFSVALATTLLTQTIAAVDAGAAAPTIELYDGPQPATPDDDTTGSTLVATFTLADPSAFGTPVAVAGGVEAEAITIDPVQAVASAADANSLFFRLKDGDGVALIDGDVTLSGGGGMLEIDADGIVAGITIKVTSLFLMQPTI